MTGSLTSFTQHSRLQRLDSNFLWLLYAREELTLDALLAATEIKQTGINRILSICRGCIYFDSQLKVVRFVHHSVQEFLRLQQALETDQAEELLALSCLCASRCKGSRIASLIASPIRTFISCCSESKRTPSIDYMPTGFRSSYAELAGYHAQVLSDLRQFLQNIQEDNTKDERSRKFELLSCGVSLISFKVSIFLLDPHVLFAD